MALALGAWSAGCGGPETPQATVPSATAEATASPSGAPSAEGTARPAAESGTVALSPLEKTELTVKVGTKLTYGFRSHGSVGYGASQSIDGKGVVKLVREDREYEQTPEQRAGKTGADAARGVYVFEAVGKGKAKLTVNELFRGATQQSHTFTITVE